MDLPLQQRVAALPPRLRDSGQDRDGALERLLLGINPHNSTAGDQHVLRVVEQRLTLLDLGARARGLRPLQPGVLTGPYVLATDVASGVPVRVRGAHLARTTILSGATGTGKTTLLHQLVDQT